MGVCGSSVYYAEKSEFKTCLFCSNCFNCGTLLNCTVLHVDMNCTNFCNCSAAHCILQPYNQHLSAGACWNMPGPPIKMMFSAPWDCTTRWQLKPRRGSANAVLISHSFPLVIRKRSIPSIRILVSAFKGFLPYFGLHDRLLQPYQKERKKQNKTKNEWNHKYFKYKNTWYF